MAPHERLAIEEVRVRLLRSGQHLRLRADAGAALMCCCGSIRIAQPGNPKANARILVAGERFTFEVGGVALLTALQGMTGEWLEDTGISLLRLPAALAASQ